MEHVKVQTLALAKEGQDEIPSCVAISKFSDTILFGYDALNCSENDFDLLIDWKIFVGKTSAEIQAEATSNEVLRTLLKRFDGSLQPLLDLYVKKISRKLLAFPFQETPDFIVGIPVTADYETSQWRRRYKDCINKAFRNASLEKPHYFPEPFAVFQHHWNKKNITDTGDYQNILVVDIGGGTTNSCLIQTTTHGILARGGGNNIPHGVRSVMIGGSVLDKLILERANLLNEKHSKQFLTIASRQAKETLSKTIGSSEWEDDDTLTKTKATLFISKEKVGEISALSVKQAFEDHFWPSIKDTISLTIKDSQEKRLPKPINRIDQIILAGGTSQLSIVEHRFLKDFILKNTLFENARILREPNYSTAVANGLAIEAFANCKHHKVRPTRISAFVNEDIQLQISHDRHSLSAPPKLSLKSGNLNIKKDSGVIIAAPVNVSPLINKPLEWSFKFKQKPTDVYYKFNKAEPGTNNIEECLTLSNSHVRVAKKNGKKTTNARIRAQIDEQGFLKSFLGFSGEKEEFELEPADLHDLSGLEGNCFLGLDLGTNSTICSFVNAKDALELESIPENYWSKKQVIERSFTLENEAKTLLRANNGISDLNKRLLADYVYHSNRIEGSQLGRGETQSILNEINPSLEKQSPEMEVRVEQFSFIDQDTGEIKHASRPIKDGMAAINLRDAFEFVENIAFSSDERFGPFELKQIHQLVMRGEHKHTPGDYRFDDVSISETTYVPPEHFKVTECVEAMFSRFSTDEFRSLPAIIQATEAHVWFASIHPFSDGNGRVARLLANYFLWRNGLPGINIIWENRDRYYDALDYCNSKDVANRGDLTDVALLFCDAFEDTLEDIRLHQTQQSEESEAIDHIEKISTKEARPSEFEGLLSRISKKAIANTIKQQYSVWLNDFSLLISKIRKLVQRLDETLSVEFKGSARVLSYPIIDEETFIAICRHQRFSRTWFFKFQITLEDKKEELVFYFAPASKEAGEAAEELKSTCSLHVSRYETESLRHVRVTNESWSRVLEICHDGSSLFIFRHEGSENRYNYILDQIKIDEWFTMIIEDLIQNVFMIEI